MFGTVQSLTNMIDKDLKFLEEGIASKENHSKEVYDAWLENITESLNRRMARLKELSCNESLIAKYESKVIKALEAI